MSTFSLTGTQPAPANVDDHIQQEKERLAGLVQAVHRMPADIPRRRWESLAVFLTATAAYSWFGYWLVVKMHVVGFETLDRMNRALMIWHNDPAKLSALGFDYPPLTTLLIAPLAISRTVASSLWVIPLTSAIFAGVTMMSLNTLARRAQVAAPLRIAILVALGLNPLVLLYSSGGARQVISTTFVVVALGAIVGWYVTANVRFVMLSGIAFSIAVLSGYSSVLWFVIAACMIAAILARLGATGEEIEGTTVGFSAPALYTIALWTVFNLILFVNPFNWVTIASDSGGGNPGSFSVVELIQGTFWMVLAGAPIAFVVLPALIFVGVARGNTLALGLSVMLGAAIVAPALTVLVDLTDSPLQLRNCLPILFFSVIGALWLIRSADAASPLVAGGLVLGLLISVPTTFYSMEHYRYQTLEHAFTAAVRTGESQEGTKTLSGAAIGVVDEQAMADYIKDNISQPSAILTDNSQTYAVMLMTGRPELFFDRVDRSDGPWKAMAADPGGKVPYLLMTVNDSADLLAQYYPEAASGADPRLLTIYKTGRYVLYGVPDSFRPDTAVDDVTGLPSSTSSTDSTGEGS